MRKKKRRVFSQKKPRQFRTIGVVTSVNISICYTVPCHLFNDKIRSDKPQITWKKKRRKQSRIKKPHSLLIRNSCFDSKASFSRLLKLTPLRLGFNFNNSYWIIACTLLVVVEFESHERVRKYSSCMKHT